MEATNGANYGHKKPELAGIYGLIFPSLPGDALS